MRLGLIESVGRAMPVTVATDPPQLVEDRVARLEASVRGLHEQLVDEIDAQRNLVIEKIRDEVDRATAGERDQREPIERLVLDRMNVKSQKIGVALLVAGLALSTAANLLSMYA